MDAGWVVGTMLIATVIAFLLLFGLHWATGEAAGRELHPLTCYLIGCASILVILLFWCVAQGERIPAVTGWLAAMCITGGAGLGTAAGHALDGWAAMRREKAFRDGQRRAEADRDR